MKSIVDLQREDHAYMNELFERYRSGSHDRNATFRELVALVTTHAFAEEEILFPASRRVLSEGTGEGISFDIEQKHQRINDLLREMESMKPGDPGFDQRVDELFPLLSADAREEEDVLLPKLAANLEQSELERIGTAWAAAKSTAPNRAHPHVSRRPPGNVLAGIPLFFVDRMRGLIAKARNTPQ